jgi:hypothetical protein
VGAGGRGIGKAIGHQIAVPAIHVVIQVAGALADGLGRQK